MTQAGKPLSIAMFASTDGGGAGIAARRLHDGFFRLGLQADMAVASKREEHERIHLIALGEEGAVRTQSGVASVRNLLITRKTQIRLQREYPGKDPHGELFSSDECAYRLADIPLAVDASLINLHWVANFVSLDGAAVRLRNKPVFWTLHDMRPFTGGCHYSDGCTRYTGQCGACPQLGSSDERDASFTAWRRQMAAYRKLNLHIVAPSGWLADRARESSLFGRFPVHVVENGHPMRVFRPLNRGVLREQMGITPDEFVIGFSADDLRNRRKGLRYLFECLERLGAGGLRGDIRVLLLGQNPPDALRDAGIRVDTVGRLSKIEDIAAYYNLLDVLALPSLEDNAPNVIIEAAACGTPTLAFAAGGIPGMITHGETGWLAPVKDVQGLVKGIEALRAKGDPGMRPRCRAAALERWNAPAQAGKYKELFEEAVRAFHL